MEFINENKIIQALPDIEDIELHPLRPEYLRVSLISTIGFYTLLFLCLAVAYLIDSEILPFKIFVSAAVLIMVLMVFSGLLKIWGFKFKAYGLRDHDILYKSGLIWRNEIIVPFNRIQHVELGQGPIERYLNLAKVKIFTAGGNASDLSIPGLNYDEAMKIKEFLVSKTRLYE